MFRLNPALIVNVHKGPLNLIKSLHLQQRASSLSQVILLQHGRRHECCLR